MFKNDTDLFAFNRACHKFYARRFVRAFGQYLMARTISMNVGRVRSFLGLRCDFTAPEFDSVSYNKLEFFIGRGTVFKDQKKIENIETQAADVSEKKE